MANHKHITIKALASAAFISCLAGSAMAQGVFVHPYDRHDGTHVQEHYRSYPDSTPSNNWSVYPNVNPHTFEYGTRSPTFPGNPYHLIGNCPAPNNYHC
jgi:hypothetical protein